MEEQVWSYREGKGQGTRWTDGHEWKNKYGHTERGRDRGLGGQTDTNGRTSMVIQREGGTGDWADKRTRKEELVWSYRELERQGTGRTDGHEWKN